MDIGADTWTEDDNANIAAAPYGAPEGMAPSGVNNVLRAHQGAIKRWYGWSVPRATGGNGVAYTLVYAATPSLLVDGMTHLVQFHAANAAGATLAVHALGALPLHYHAAGQWRPVPPSLWDPEEVFRVAYHAASGAYRLLHLRNRTGEIQAHGAAIAPAGSLPCAGQAVSRMAYAGLFAALGTTYGAGDGTTTFNLPDLRDRTAIGKGDMGGTAANRITAAVSAIDTTVLGASGGAEKTNAAVTGSTSGSLSVSVGGITDGPTGANGLAGTGAGGYAPGLYHTHAFGATGSTSGSLAINATAAARTLQPGLVVNYVIRT